MAGQQRLVVRQGVWVVLAALVVGLRGAVRVCVRGRWICYVSGCGWLWVANKDSQFAIWSERKGESVWGRDWC